jgi:hypothetical protein
VGLLLDDVERLERKLEAARNAQTPSRKRRIPRLPVVLVLAVALPAAAAAFGSRALAPDLTAVSPDSSARIGAAGVPNPNAQPYDIVFRSLADFGNQTKGTGARLVPWLQDFSLGVEYGPAEVRAQIRAAAARGIDEWLLWDPHVTYTADALPPAR